MCFDFSSHALNNYFCIKLFYIFRKFIIPNREKHFKHNVRISEKISFLELQQLSLRDICAETNTYEIFINCKV